jgi:tetratricopeptide (TPR) repeat protein
MLTFRPRRWLTSWRLLLAVAATAAIAWFGGRHAWAWYNLRSARTELARYHPAEGQKYLVHCLTVWPNSVEARLLESRADRQNGDFDAAAAALRQCQMVAGNTSDEMALEWALLQAARGNLREVEEFLQRRVEKDPSRAPLVWEALAQGQIAVYRTLDAMACLDHWLKTDPDNLRALELRGTAYQTGHALVRGAEDLRRVIERDPSRDGARWRLIVCLLGLGRHAEALPHLERLQRERSDDPEVLVRLARCHHVLGRGAEARKLLDGVLERHPNHALTLRTRGQFALGEGQGAEAEGWLHRAAEADRFDYQTQYLLWQALEMQKKIKEARAQRQIVDAMKERSERLGELSSRKLSEQPLDPSLHYEMGVLLLRSGQSSVAEGWLRSALSLDPNYRPAHEALAEYYQSKGEQQLAEEHRRRAGK